MRKGSKTTNTMLQPSCFFLQWLQWWLVVMSLLFLCSKFALLPTVASCWNENMKAVGKGRSWSGQTLYFYPWNKACRSKGLTAYLYSGSLQHWLRRNNLPTISPTTNYKFSDKAHFETYYIVETLKHHLEWKDVSPKVETLEAEAMSRDSKRFMLIGAELEQISAISQPY